MIENLPNWINVLFIIVVLAVVSLFYVANGRSSKLLLLLMSWVVFQSVLAFSGFYQTTDTFPPRLLLALLPPTVLIIYQLRPNALQKLYQTRDPKISLFIHTARIPIEIVLYYLFINGMVPELMTFSGRNFDILAGLSAPIILFLWYLGKISYRGLIGWNFLCLGLVLFILLNGILSTQSPFQQFGFEQPNRAIQFFPFVLLGSLIVPIVIYTHITDILLLNHLNKKAQ